MTFNHVQLILAFRMTFRMMTFKMMTFRTKHSLRLFRTSIQYYMISNHFHLILALTMTFRMIFYSTQNLFDPGTCSGPLIFFVNLEEPFDRQIYLLELHSEVIRLVSIFNIYVVCRIDTGSLLRILFLRGGGTYF